MTEQASVEVKAVCQNCEKYDRETKKCQVVDEFTRRKATCAEFQQVKK